MLLYPLNGNTMKTELLSLENFWVLKLEVVHQLLREVFIVQNRFSSSDSEDRSLEPDELTRVDDSTNECDLDSSRTVNDFMAICDIHKGSVKGLESINIEAIRWKIEVQMFCCIELFSSCTTSEFNFI